MFFPNKGFLNDPSVNDPPQFPAFGGFRLDARPLSSLGVSVYRECATDHTNFSPTTISGVSGVSSRRATSSAIDGSFGGFFRAGGYLRRRSLGSGVRRRLLLFPTRTLFFPPQESETSLARTGSDEDRRPLPPRTTSTQSSS